MKKIKVFDELNKMIEESPLPKYTSEKPNDWEERFDLFTKNMGGWVFDNDGESFKSFIREERDDIIRQFATGEFILSDVGKKFKAEIKEEILNRLKIAKYELSSL